MLEDVNGIFLKKAENFQSNIPLDFLSMRVLFEK